MPRQKLRVRQAFPALRLDQSGAVVGQQFRFGVVAAHQVAAEHDLVVPRQHGERAEVEDLVVEGTKREAVLNHVRPARLEPLDVRGLPAKPDVAWLNAIYTRLAYIRNLRIMTP